MARIAKLEDRAATTHAINRLGRAVDKAISTRSRRFSTPMPMALTAFIMAIFPGSLRGTGSGMCIFLAPVTW